MFPGFGGFGHGYGEPFLNGTANAVRRSIHSRLRSRRNQRLEQPWFRSFDPNFVPPDFHTLHQRLNMMTTKSTFRFSDLFASFDPKPAKQVWGHMTVAVLVSAFSPFRIGTRRVANS